MGTFSCLYYITRNRTRRRGCGWFPALNWANSLGEIIFFCVMSPSWSTFWWGRDHLPHKNSLKVTFANQAINNCTKFTVTNQPINDWGVCFCFKSTNQSIDTTHTNIGVNQSSKQAQMWTCVLAYCYYLSPGSFPLPFPCSCSLHLFSCMAEYPTQPQKLKVQIIWESITASSVHSWANYYDAG